MKHFLFFLLLVLSCPIASRAKGSNVRAVQVQISSNDRLVGKLTVELFNDYGFHERLVYDAEIIGTQRMRFGLVGKSLIKLPSEFIRGDFATYDHVYVLEAFKRKLLEVTEMDDADLLFVPTKKCE